MKLTQAEWQIMNALWEKHPATARDIMSRLPKDVKWAYTTLKTMLSRLVEKEAVSEQKQSNTSVYEPLISQRKARLSAFRPPALKARVGKNSIEEAWRLLANDIRRARRLYQLWLTVEVSATGL